MSSGDVMAFAQQGPVVGILIQNLQQVPMAPIGVDVPVSVNPGEENGGRGPLHAPIPGQEDIHNLRERFFRLQKVLYAGAPELGTSVSEAAELEHRGEIMQCSMVLMKRDFEISFANMEQIKAALDHINNIIAKRTMLQIVSDAEHEFHRLAGLSYVD